MDMETQRPLIEKLKLTKNLIIIAPPKTSGDALGAALALAGVLKKLEKDVLMLSPAMISPRFDFLPGIDQIQTKLNLAKQLIIDLSTQTAQVAEVSYKKDIDKLSIYIKPKEGQFETSDVSVRSTKFPYDLVICVGVAALEHLGEFYSRNAELFFETPVVNIDYRINNENYGQINLVDLNANSVSEIVYDLIVELDEKLIDSDTATNLLAGIIEATNSFQHVRTTPQAFVKASQLISLGGRQQDIISHMYKNKSLGLLKLWGRVLACMKQDDSRIMVSSAVSLSDIERVGATEEDIQNIIKEMADQLGFAKVFVFFSEISPDKTRVLAATSLPINLVNLFAGLETQVMDSSVKFTVNLPLLEAEKQTSATISEEFAKLR